jgi:hypothetical protein
MRHAALDPRRRSRPLVAALALLVALAAWAVAASGEPAAAQTGTCSGDATATTTLYDDNFDDQPEPYLATAIPASCDIGLRTDGRTAKNWSIDVYDAADGTKRYFCHRAIAAPPGEPVDCTGTTNPPNTSVTAAITKDEGAYRLYIDATTSQQNFALNVRAHYAWQGTGPSDPPPDQCPAEPGTGPCTAPEPTGKFDLKATLTTVPSVAPDERYVPVTLHVSNTSRAQRKSPASTITLSILAGTDRDFGAIDLKQVKQGDSPLVDCGPLAGNEEALACSIPPLRPDSGVDVPLEVPAAAERVFLLGIVGAGGRKCKDAEEITCGNNRTGEYAVNVPVPESKIEQPDLSATGEIFFEGSSSRSKTLDVMRVARTATSGPRVTRVEVAVVRKGGKGRAAAVRCQWLKNGRADFKRVRAGSKNLCDRPLWLRAKGRARWHFSGTKSLPKGHYVLYARATDRAGHRTSRFTNKRGNRVEFSVG